MDLMKALRRSMKGGDKHKPSPSIGSSKAAFAIVPPKKVGFPLSPEISRRVKGMCAATTPPARQRRGLETGKRLSIEGLLLTPLCKVIRANDDYQPDEALVQSFAKAGVLVLGFSKGDFFHVIGREDDPHWYEACNPALPDARGLVPVSYFQVLGRTERDSTHSDSGRMPMAKNPDHDSGYGETAIQHVSAPPQRNSKSSKTAGTVYAKVRHTFTAHPTRPDELSAEKDENLIIIAQSNHEWVVAKPIMRLGGPGLIPLDFIYVFEEVPMGTGSGNGPMPVDDPRDALRKAHVPSVEEWKRMAAQYKNSSITLGKFDGAKAAPGQQPTIEQGMGRLSLQQQPGARHSNQNGSQVCRFHPRACLLRSPRLFASSRPALTLDGVDPRRESGSCCTSQSTGAGGFVSVAVGLTAVCASLGADTTILLRREQILVCHRDRARGRSMLGAVAILPGLLRLPDRTLGRVSRRSGQYGNAEAYAPIHARPRQLRHGCHHRGSLVQSRRVRQESVEPAATYCPVRPGQALLCAPRRRLRDRGQCQRRRGIPAIRGLPSVIRRLRCERGIETLVTERRQWIRLLWSLCHSEAGQYLAAR